MSRGPKYWTLEPIGQLEVQQELKVGHREFIHYISTSGFGVGVSRRSFIAVFGPPVQVKVRPILLSVYNVGVL